MKKAFALFFYSVSVFAIDLPVQNFVQLSQVMPSLGSSQKIGLSETKLNAHTNMPLNLSVLSMGSIGKFSDVYKETIVSSFFGYSFGSPITLYAGASFWEESIPSLGVDRRIVDLSIGGDIMLRFFRARFLYRSNRLQSGSLSFFNRNLFPMEIQFAYESINDISNIAMYTVYYLNSKVGFRLGVDYFASSFSVGAWISFQENFQIDTNISLPSAKREETLGEVSLRYFFGESAGKTGYKNSLAQRKKIFEKKDRDKRKSSAHKKKYFAKNKSFPSFQTLLRWGISPVESLKMVRAKNICAGSLRSQKIAAQKKWKCRRKK